VRDVKSYFRKSATSSLLNTLVSALSTVFLLPTIIREIGLESYGLWAVVGIFVGLTSILDLGIWKSLVYLILKGQHSFDELISSAILLSTIIAGAFAVALVIVLLMNVPIFGAVASSHKDLGWWLGLGGCAVVFFSLFANVARGALEALFRGHILYAGFALVTLLQYGVAALISQWSTNPRALIAGSVGVYAAILLLHGAFLLCVKRVRLVLPTWNAMIAIIKYGLPAFVTDLPAILLGPTLLYLFVLGANNAGEYGIFDIALKIATLAASAVSMLAMPVFALSATAEPSDHATLRLIVNRYLRITVSLAFFGCVIYWLIGQWALGAFFRERPDQIFWTSLYMLVGGALVAAFEPVARMLMGLGRLTKLAVVRSLTLVVTLTMIQFLHAIQPLDRFAISVGTGLAASSIGLLLLYRKELWSVARSDTR
jgi:O-antigen/teichoic acid export membrane protein